MEAITTCREMVFILRQIHIRTSAAIDAFPTYRQAMQFVKKGQRPKMATMRSIHQSAGFDFRGLVSETNVISNAELFLTQADHNLLTAYNNCRKKILHYVSTAINDQGADQTFREKGSPAGYDSYKRAKADPESIPPETLRALAWVLAGGDREEFDRLESIQIPKRLKARKMARPRYRRQA